MVPIAGLEPASRKAVDFESTEFTNFSISAQIFDIKDKLYFGFYQNKLKGKIKTKLKRA